MSKSDLRDSKTEKKFFALPASNRTVFRRYFVSTFMGNLVLPVFSLFVPLLAQRLGADVFQIGLVGGASNAVYSFMPFVMGRFSDRKKLGKLFIVSSFILLTIVSISYILIDQPVFLIIARVFEGVGWAMLWPAIEAEIGKNLAAVEAKKVFSLFNITWSGAAAIGPLLGAALIFFTTIQYAFFATVLILLFSAAINIYPILVSRSVTDGTVNISATELESEKKSSGENHRTKSPSSAGLVFYMASCALAAVTSGILFTFFAPYARSIGLSILLVGGITFVFGLGRFLTYVITINESVRLLLLRNDKRVRNMIIVLTLTTVPSFILLFHDPSGLAYFFAYAVLGSGSSVVFGIAQAGMIAEATAGSYGRNAGLFESAIGIGACLGPIIAGSVSGNSITIPFIVPAIGLGIYLASVPLTTRMLR